MLSGSTNELLLEIPIWELLLPNLLHILLPDISHICNNISFLPSFSSFSTLLTDRLTHLFQSFIVLTDLCESRVAPINQYLNHTLKDGIDGDTSLSCPLLGPNRFHQPIYPYTTPITFSLLIYVPSLILLTCILNLTHFFLHLCT